MHSSDVIEATNAFCDRVADRAEQVADRYQEFYAVRGAEMAPGPARTSIIDILIHYQVIADRYRQMARDARAAKLQ